MSTATIFTDGRPQRAVYSPQEAHGFRESLRTQKNRWGAFLTARDLLLGHLKTAGTTLAEVFDRWPLPRRGKPLPTPPPSQAVDSMRMTPSLSCRYSSLNPTGAAEGLAATGDAVAEAVGETAAVGTARGTSTAFVTGVLCDCNAKIPPAPTATATMAAPATIAVRRRPRRGSCGGACRYRGYSGGDNTGVTGS